MAQLLPSSTATDEAMEIFHALLLYTSLGGNRPGSTAPCRADIRQKQRYTGKAQFGSDVSGDGHYMKMTADAFVMLWAVLIRFQGRELGKESQGLSRCSMSKVSSKAIAQKIVA